MEFVLNQRFRTIKRWMITIVLAVAVTFVSISLFHFFRWQNSIGFTPLNRFSGYSIGLLKVAQSQWGNDDNIDLEVILSEEFSKRMVGTASSKDVTVGFSQNNSLRWEITIPMDDLQIECEGTWGIGFGRLPESSISRLGLCLASILRYACENIFSDKCRYRELNKIFYNDPNIIKNQEVSGFEKSVNGMKIVAFYDSHVEIISDGQVYEFYIDDRK